MKNEKFKIRSLQDHQHLSYGALALIVDASVDYRGDTITVPFKAVEVRRRFLADRRVFCWLSFVFFCS